MINFNLKINDTVYCVKDVIRKYYHEQVNLEKKKIINLKNKYYKILDINEYYDTVCDGKAICIVLETEIDIFTYWILENEVYKDFIGVTEYINAHMFYDYFTSMTEYRKLKLKNIQNND